MKGSLVFIILLFNSVSVIALDEPLPNYDIRFTANATALKSTAILSQTTVSRMKQAESRLARTIPWLKVKYNAVLEGAEIVETAGGYQYLTPESNENRETILRNFLSRNAGLYGLTSDQVTQLKTVANYTNPSGNLSWIKMQQIVNGIPVFQGQLRAAFTATGQLIRTVSLFASLLDYSSLASSPSISANEGIAMYRRFNGVEVTKLHVDASLQYFPVRTGVAVLSWSMILQQGDYEYYILLNAENGELLFRKNLTNDQSQSATYVAYSNDSPSPLSPSNATPGSGIQGAGVGRSTFTLVSELPAFDNLGWIPDGGNTTTGNNVDAGLDLDADGAIDAFGRPTGSPLRVFDFTYNPPPLGSDDPAGSNFRFGAVTNIFFWGNRYHDLVYQLGFVEAEGNFQNNNFGRGGSDSDAVTVLAQRIKKNASFSTGPDGHPPKLSTGIFTDPTVMRDSDLDQDIVLHEFTHGLSNRLHADAAGLNFSQSGGMGEGWSDFYARAILSDATEDANGIYAAGAYSTLDFEFKGNLLGTDNYYYGIRRFPYAVKSNVGPNGKPHNPLTLADIDEGQMDLTDGAYPESPLDWSSGGAREVHNVGEIWCTALLEVRSRLISKYGFEIGNQRMLQIVTDGMKFDPADPSLLDGRDSILAAECSAYGGVDEFNIWKGFAARGMGFSAKVSPAFFSPNSVKEAFDMPNVAVGNVSFSEPPSSCQNGFLDPGEKVDVVVPLDNPLCAASIKKVVAKLSGVPNSAKNYGTIPPGASVSRSFHFKIPKSASCGDPFQVILNVKDSLGNVSREFFLNTGQPVITFSETFDGVSPPDLPIGWSSAASFSLVPWVSANAESHTTPNSAFGFEGNGGGVSELISPPISITSPKAQLIFQHHVHIKFGSDALLTISLDGAPFQDILAAGGTFEEGPYFFSSWFGDSEGFFRTVVNLPASAAGHSIQLSWKISSSSSGLPAEGWNIDDVQIIQGYVCCQ